MVYGSTDVPPAWTMPGPAAHSGRLAVLSSAEGRRWRTCGLPKADRPRALGGASHTIRLECRDHGASRSRNAHCSTRNRSHETLRSDSQRYRCRDGQHCGGSGGDRRPHPVDRGDMRGADGAVLRCRRSRRRVSRRSRPYRPRLRGPAGRGAHPDCRSRRPEGDVRGASGAGRAGGDDRRARTRRCRSRTFSGRPAGRRRAGGGNVGRPAGGIACRLAGPIACDLLLRRPQPLVLPGLGPDRTARAAPRRCRFSGVRSTWPT